MSEEGRLQITLTRQDGHVGAVDIVSTRPLQIARVFEAKTPDAVLQLLPLLYSICAMAQTQAAQLACERALGITPPRGVRLARELLVCLETAREHLWRILIDWPALIDEDRQAALAAPLTRLLPESRKALFVDGRAFGFEVKLHAADWALQDLAGTLDGLLERAVYGCSAREWLTIRDRAALDDWSAYSGGLAARVLRRLQDNGWENVGAVSPAFLPVLSNNQLAARLSAPDAETFIARPDWEGVPRETTPLARQREVPLIHALLTDGRGGLLARMAALLVELADLPMRARELSLALREDRGLETAEEGEGAATAGAGLVQVEAARGRLAHCVELEHGSVRRYRILAPTEWNFHPEGAAAQALLNLPDGDVPLQRRLAGLLINAIDPCVDYDLVVN
jgi:coenzyme F420-reducing hydrogenase alpha subunit